MPHKDLKDRNACQDRCHKADPTRPKKMRKYLTAARARRNKTLQEAMKLKLGLLALPFILAASLLAAPLVQIDVRAKESADLDRITFLANHLNFSHQPMIHYWEIVVLDRPDWDDAVHKWHIEGQTETAFSILPWDITYIRGEYVRYSLDGEVKHTLAHEAGHFICECNSEDKANKIAEQLER